MNKTKIWSLPEFQSWFMDGVEDAQELIAEATAGIVTMDYIDEQLVAEIALNEMDKVVPVKLSVTQVAYLEGYYGVLKLFAERALSDNSKLLVSLKECYAKFELQAE